MKAIEELKRQVKQARQKNPQFFDVKQRYEIAYSYRCTLRGLLDKCRNMLTELNKTSDELEKIYLSYDIQFLKKQIHDVYRLYRLAQADAVETSEYYGEKSKKSAPYSYTSSRKRRRVA